MFSFLSKKIGSVVDSIRGLKSLDEESLKPFFKKVKDCLVESDVPLKSINNFIEKVKEKCLDKKITKKNIELEEYVSKVLYDTLFEILGGKIQLRDSLKEIAGKKGLKVVFVCGTQGVGKTTTIGKILNHLLKKTNLKKEEIVTVSLDYDRPAAREQLNIVSRKEGVESYLLSDENLKNDIVASAKQMYEKASKEGKKIIIFDTAGRLHIDQKVMGELKLIWNEVKPNLTFLVLDMMMGQLGIEIAEAFSSEVNIDKVIMTKVDGDAPGGIILGLMQEVGLSIGYITTGEKSENIENFSPEKITKRILGLGDFATLAEMAKEKIQKSDEEFFMDILKSGNMDIDAYSRFIKLMQRFGPLKALISMLPKSEFQGLSDQNIDSLEDMNNKFLILNNSMNLKERKQPDLILKSESRKKRISLGSGIKIEDVDSLLKKFNEIRESFKNLKQKFPFLM